jgi:ATP-dependent DNA helicase RecQ
MATFYPQSPDGLLALHGVGLRKLDQYGDQFLAVIRAYCAERGLAEKPWQARELARVARTPSRPGGRTQQIGALFAAGQNIDDICASLGFVRSTIVGHLARFQQGGGALDPARLLASVRLSPEDRTRALAAFDACGTEYLSPVYQALGGAVPYEELHVLRLYLNATAAKRP